MASFSIFKVHSNSSDEKIVIEIRLTDRKIEVEATKEDFADALFSKAGIPCKFTEKFIVQQ